MSSDKNPDYVLPVNQTEWARLDEQSNGMDALLGRLLPANVKDPKKILEIGAGGGGWAINVAKAHPGAEIIAADMNPLPDRPLPSNLQYKKVNALEPFPFPAGSFDVVHARLTMCHLIDGKKVLTRLIDLLTPGGTLLIDDINWPADFSGLDNAPGIKGGLTFVITGTKAVGGDPHFGTGLKAALDASPELSSVDVQEVWAPLNGKDDGTPVATWGRLFRDTLTRAVEGAPGITTDAQKATQKEFLANMADKDLDWSYSVGFYFAVCKKKSA
ncbi:methyltransferase str2 [Favolaschia claudopus]|uniref:Methyltransferase str2 n=1 Tax=Favolaschia claudopus TaxID=2862362 RepID=A0AAW0CLW6_9AGAR